MSTEQVKVIRFSYDDGDVHIAVVDPSITLRQYVADYYAGDEDVESITFADGYAEVACNGYIMYFEEELHHIMKGTANA